MNVGFFLVDTGTVDSAMGPQCASALIQSVRRSMPDVPVTHFTDESTPMVEGADAVQRMPSEPMARLRLRLQSSVDGEWLFVDSDVIIVRDVRPVFSAPFDVAITTRNWTHLTPAAGFTKRMPYNVGVVFSRHRGFWKEAYKRLLKQSPQEQHWMGDQQVICDMVKESRYRFAFLKGSRYNLPPSLDREDAESLALENKAYILHYKGMERKALMLARIRGEAEACA